MCNTMIYWDCPTGSVSYNDMLGLFYRDRECVRQWYAGIVLQGQGVCPTMIYWDCPTGTGSV